MAQDDIELNIGVNFDENEFSNAYGKILDNLQTQTKQYVAGALDEMKGAASKAWGQLPYYSMHDAGSGNANATKAFLPSLAQDLNAMGFDKTSDAYQSAMMNAVYKSSIPDAMQRYHQMLSQGFMQQADLTHPDTALGKAIETDYALMSQPWSRDFIRTDDSGAYIDFNNMRKYAVEAGLGQWIDPEKEHTADNFELINDELEKIEEASTKSDKTFKGWNDTLKNVLGTLTAIGSLAGIAKALEVSYKAAEKGTTQAATSLPRTRALVGMNALEVLTTQVAGQSVGLGKDDVYNEIVSLSNRRQEYKLLGQGLDALFPSLSGIFDNIMSGDNPYDVYKGILTELYGALQGADDDTRAQALMLLSKQDLGGAAYIVGSFLSNPVLAAQMGNDPANLFTLKSNPYRASYPRSEATLPELTQLNESLKASYQQMYLDWEDAFGLPFKRWWNTTLMQTVIPWFEKILQLTKPENVKTMKEQAAIDKAWDKYVKKQEKANSVSNREKISGYWSTAASKAYYLNKEVSWDDYAPERGLYTSSGWEAVKNINSDEPKKFLASLKKMATEGVYAPGSIHKRVQSRAEAVLQWLHDTQLENDLGDLRTTDVDKYTMRVIKEYLAEGDDKILETYLTEAYTHSEGWKILLEFISEYRTYLKQHPEELREKFTYVFGGQPTPQLAAEAERELNRVVNK